MAELTELKGINLELNLSGRKKALATLAGSHYSAFRGRGIDFDESRIYQPGDDIRNIDWRVTARTGRTHTKVFREERERPVYLMVDQRHSMFFGSKTAFKSVVAARIAALLAWSVLKQGDRIGGFLFNDDSVQEVRPSKGKRGIQSFFRLLIQFNQALELQPAGQRSMEHSLSEALAGLNQVVRPGSLTVLISDFRPLSDDASHWLSLLRNKSDVLAIQIADPMERQLPKAGLYGFSDGDRHLRLNTAPQPVRQRFAIRYVEQQAALKQVFLNSGIPLLELFTDDDIVAKLKASYGARSGGSARR